MAQKIFISGSIGYDEIMNFPNHFKDYFHPEKLHQINVSFAVDSLAKHLGGCSTNIAYSLRNTLDYLANPKLEILNPNQTLNTKEGQNSLVNICPVGAVGKDGEQLIEFFKSNNIDTSNILQDKKLYTATGKVITDKNDNQIWGFYYGASALDTRLWTLDSGLWILSATHERPFTTALKHVIKNKLPYLFDPGMTLTWIQDDLLKKGVLNCTYLIGNDYEIAMIEKRLKMTVAEIVEKGVNVITTLGEKGVRFNSAIDSKKTRHLSQVKSVIVKGIKLRKVVDPTGAGDAWRGGFVGALVAGKDIKECLVMGNVMASFAVECVGTVEYKVDAGEIQKRVKSITKK